MHNNNSKYACHVNYAYGKYLMITVKKFMWMLLGIICLLSAIYSIFCPFVPTSPSIIAAAYCFSKGSHILNDWINNNGLFGPIIDDWKNYRIFPTTYKLLLIVAAEIMLLAIWTLTHSIVLIMVAATIMSIAVGWIWKYPGSNEELDKRVANNKKIGWF